jgi:hypothetical protein
MTPVMVTQFHRVSSPREPIVAANSGAAQSRKEVQSMNLKAAGVFGNALLCKPVAVAAG